jgi:hypothetical protein
MVLCDADVRAHPHCSEINDLRYWHHPLPLPCNLITATALLFLNYLSG